MVQIESALIFMHFMDVQPQKQKQHRFNAHKHSQNSQIPSPHSDLTALFWGFMLVLFGNLERHRLEISIFMSL
jgi:hypothetical protein